MTNRHGSSVGSKAAWNASDQELDPPCRDHSFIKGSPTTKTNTCIKNLPVKTKMTFLSRKSIVLAILLHEQFIPYTQISLHPNIHFFTAQQRAYQSFLSYFLVGFCLHPSGILGKF